MAPGQAIVIEIDQEGVMSAVWSDDNPLLGSGQLSVTRLSDVEYCPQAGGWKVTFRNGVELPETFQKRADALQAEVRYVEEHLGEFAEWVKQQQAQEV